jgi:hypothetical protein
MHTAKSFMPESSASEAEGATGKLRSCKSAGVDHSQAELIHARGETLLSDIHERIKLNWNKDELPQQCEESFVEPVHKKGVKTDCSNYRGVSLPSTSKKILSNILLSGGTPYADEIIGAKQCGF